MPYLIQRLDSRLFVAEDDGPDVSDPERARAFRHFRDAAPVATPTDRIVFWYAGMSIAEVEPS